MTARPTWRSTLRGKRGGWRRRFSGRSGAPADGEEGRGEGMRVALITGASSGLGREYARRAVASGAYDEVWVVARRERRLRELADELGPSVVPVPLDLTDRASVDGLAGLLRSREAEGPFEVGLLVNAAGLGKFGTYADLSLDEVDAMVDLNCRALVELTQVVLPHMRRGGRIIQVASSASFQPLPVGPKVMTPELTSKPSAFAWTRSSPAIEVTHSSVCVSPGQYENPPLDNCLEYSDVSI